MDVPTTLTPEESTQRLPTNRKKYLPLIMGMVVIALIVGAYYLGTQNNSVEKQEIISQNSDSTPQPDKKAVVPTLMPTKSVTHTPVIIPTDWKKYTDEDPQFGLKTTLALPPGFSFRFTGSEWTIQNDSDATELWDYATSISLNSGGNPENTYDGESRRKWYSDFLRMYRPDMKIVNVTEVPLNSGSYLEVKVRSDMTGAETHYIFVQNNILHILRPVSDVALKSSRLVNYIPAIITSVNSVLTK